MQIRTRLTLQFIAIAASILAFILLYVYKAYQSNTEKSFFDGLRIQATGIAETTLKNESNLTALPPISSDNEGDVLPFKENISIFNNSYERVFSLLPQAQPVNVKTLQDVQQNGEYRFSHYNLQGLGLLHQSPMGKSYVVIAEGYLDPLVLENLLNILLFSFFTGIGAVAIGGWYFAGQSLRPMQNIVRQVDAIHPNILQQRVQTGNKRDEIAKLAATFNHLLDRIERAFGMQRQFIGNVSHELKNPLTAIRTQLEVALQRSRSSEEYKRVLVSILEDIVSVSSIQEKLMQMSMIHSAPNSVAFEKVRLDELLWQAREQSLKNQPQGKIILSFEDMPEDGSAFEVDANEPLLRTAFVNLMENGCKYSSDNCVTVRIAIRQNGQHCLEFHNIGPVIPAEEIPLILQPFYRSTRHTKVKGTGVGLSLTESILKLHEIDLKISSDEQLGTVFGLYFRAGH